MRVLPGLISEPSAADLAGMLGSPAPGALMLPPDATFTYRRLTVPAAQRTPWPKLIPGLKALPWIRIDPAVAFSLAVVKVSVEAATEATPEPAMEAPPELSLLLQPRFAPDGGLEHGQGAMPGSPGVQL